MTDQQYRSILISDVHLGTPDCKSGYLLDFLRRTRSHSLYLVGDIIDLESMARRPHWRPEHGAVLGEILRKAETGARVIHIPGNHDAAFRGLRGQKIGVARLTAGGLNRATTGRCRCNGVSAPIAGLGAVCDCGLRHAQTVGPACPAPAKNARSAAATGAGVSMCR